MRILIAGVLGGIAMYIWSAVAHVVTPLGMTGVDTMPNEAAVTAAMQTSLGDRAGLYLFPAAAMTTPNLPGPSGLLVYQNRANDMTPVTLAQEAAVQIVEGVLAAFLLSLTVLAGYVMRAGFVALVGVVAVLASNPSLWIWYKFPAEFTLAAMFMDVVGYLIAGLVIAAVLKPRAAAAP